MRERRVTFAITPCAADLGVRADAEKLRQILLNLLANGAKFTGAGGRVWVSCEPLDGHVAIRVHDTGVGIPADRFDDIFEPFVQVPRSLVAPTAGTGLGLAISRQLARDARRPDRRERAGGGLHVHAHAAESVERRA